MAPRFLKIKYVPLNKNTIQNNNIPTIKNTSWLPKLLTAYKPTGPKISRLPRIDDKAPILNTWSGFNIESVNNWLVLSLKNNDVPITPRSPKKTSTSHKNNAMPIEIGRASCMERV